MNFLSASAKSKIISATATYARSFLAAAIAVYLSGNHNLSAIANAGIAAVLPVVLRALNPNDPSYGLGTGVTEPTTPENEQAA
ncbi:MAG: hypothetical protein EBY26_00290 [Microbacteriaceae bacterium]|nr:hypothetical protein [Microbacteriaceae bacterium]